MLTRPSASVADFYHELADLFGITLAHNNRWVGFKGLRQHWRAHLGETRLRPLLLVDEAQELAHPVLTEMRLLASTEFDSRIRQRLLITRCAPRELARLLDHLLEQAGNPALMTPGLKDTLVAHADGNPRALAIMADALLAAGAEHDREQLDEKLFLETWGEDVQPRRARR